MSRVLYSGTKNASSWAFRAWLALREAQVVFEERVIDIRRPQRFENLNKIGEFSPPAAVPVLVDGETVIFDSLAIMEYANCFGTVLRLTCHTPSLMQWPGVDAWSRTLLERTAIREWMAEARQQPVVRLSDYMP